MPVQDLRESHQRLVRWHDLAAVRKRDAFIASVVSACQVSLSFMQMTRLALWSATRDALLQWRSKQPRASLLGSRSEYRWPNHQQVEWYRRHWNQWDDGVNSVAAFTGNERASSVSILVAPSKNHFKPRRKRRITDHFIELKTSPNQERELQKAKLEFCQWQIDHPERAGDSALVSRCSTLETQNPRKDVYCAGSDIYRKNNGLTVLLHTVAVYWPWSDNYNVSYAC